MSDTNLTTLLLPIHVRTISAYEKPFYYVCLPLQILVALVAASINAVLFYAQARFTNWPFYQRLLFLNVTFASALAALVHMSQTSYQLWKYVNLGNGKMPGSQWSDKVGDVALTGIATGMDILTLQNLLALRKCDTHLHKTKKDTDKRSRKFATTSFMFVASWVLACLCVYFELNPQSQIYDQSHSSIGKAILSLCIGLSIEFSVIVILFMTRRISRKLQMDFEIRRAQQNLSVRTHIKETMRLTSIIFRVIIVHVIIWVASLSVGFGINRYLINDSGLNGSSEGDWRMFDERPIAGSFSIDSDSSNLSDWSRSISMYLHRTDAPVSMADQAAINEPRLITNGSILAFNENLSNNDDTRSILLNDSDQPTTDDDIEIALENLDHYENEIVAFTSIVDMITLAFNLIYPFVVVRMEPRLKKYLRLGRAGAIGTQGGGGAASRKEGAGSSTVSIVVPPVVRATTHYNAIESHWDKVAQVGSKLSPKMDAGKKRTA